MINPGQTSPEQRRKELQAFAKDALHDQQPLGRRLLPFMAIVIPAIGGYQWWAGDFAKLAVVDRVSQLTVSAPPPVNARPEIMALSVTQPARDSLASTQSVRSLALTIPSREAPAPDSDASKAFAAARLGNEIALPGMQQPALPSADIASVGQRCLAARVQANQPAGKPRNGDFTLDDRALQLRCLMTMHVEQRFCSEDERERVARAYVSYADMLDALRPRPGAKPDQTARWRDIWDSPLHKSVTEDLSDLILRGYIDQSYFGARQSPAIQALFANVTGIPDPCVRARAENRTPERPAIVVRPR